jgi:CopG family transcriptional regulator/antitoxin EndoAI
MRQQLQITLPEDTVRLINQWVKNSNSPEEERNNLIDEAIKCYVHQKQQDTLRQQLQEGAIRRAERDLNLAQEWFDTGHPKHLQI